ncbi:hypothetical protein COTS27_00204 [Spirochaetota bacterium]|nr:hypothetical protein COTS27_00204 [Spirochaetota bacterium]
MNSNLKNNTIAALHSRVCSSEKHLTTAHRFQRSPSSIISALISTFLVLIVLLSCTSTIGQRNIQQEFSDSTDILLFTLSGARNPFITGDVNFAIDNEKKTIALSLTAADLNPNAVINAKTKFIIDLALPEGASIVVNGQVIRDQTNLTLFLAKGFFEGRQLPLIIIAENKTNNEHYTISSRFEKPTFSFRYDKYKYRFKTKQRNITIKAPSTKGSARGNVFYSISPIDKYVYLNADGSLTLNPNKTALKTTTRKYVVRGRRQGIRSTRTLSITFYPNAPPTPPALVYPTDQTTTIERNKNLKLTWKPSTNTDNDPISYKVLVYDSSTTAGNKPDVPVTDKANSQIAPIIEARTTQPFYTINAKKLNPETSFNWKVIASDGYDTAASSSFTFTTVTNNAPSDFSILNPTVSASINLDSSRGSKFNWTPSVDADNDPISYFLYLSSDLKAIRNAIRVPASNKEEFKKINILQVIQLKNPQYTIPHRWLAPNTTYYWTVKASDTFSDRVAPITDFITIYERTPITILTPLNNSGSINGLLPFDLEWNPPQDFTPAEDPLYYNIYLSTNERATVLEKTEALLAENITQTNYTVTTQLNTKTTYYWKINGTTTPNTPSQSKSPPKQQPPQFISALSSFTTTNNAPTRPKLTYPLKGMDDLPRINGVLLSWEASTDLDGDPISYNVYLSRTEDDIYLEEKTAVIATDIKEPSHIVSAKNLVPRTQYFWKIVATDGKSATSSSTYRFITGKNIPPKAPTPLTPIAIDPDTSLVNPEVSYRKGVSFTWSKPSYLENDETYTVLVDTRIENLTPEQALFKSRPLSNYKFILKDLEFRPKQEYFWKIIASDTYGASNVSPPASFKTKGFSLELSRRLITARDPNNLSFTLFVASIDFLKENKLSYRYILADNDKTTPNVTGQADINTATITQKLDISDLGAGKLTLTVNIVNTTTAKTVDTFKRQLQQENFIKITSPQALTQIGKSPQFPLSGTYTVMKNLNLANVTFTPIGNDNNPFTGKFYGQNLTLNNFTMLQNTSRSSGMFGTIKDATIRDVVIRTSKLGITGGNFTGGLAGKITGASVISRIVFYGRVKGSDQIGSIAGRISGNTVISNVRSHGEVIGKDTVGGLGGRIYSGVKIVNSKSFAKISGVNDIGGLIGRGIDISIDQSSTQNAVQGRNNIGGVAGSLLQSSVNRTSSTSQIMGVRKVGGISGTISASEILNSYTVSKIIAITSAGGISGTTLNKSKINNTYSESRLRARNNVGGITGIIGSNSFILNSYVRGAIIPTPDKDDTSQLKDFGGIAGRTEGSNTLKNNFYSFRAIDPIKNFNIELTEKKKARSLRGNRGTNVPSLKKASTFQNWDFNNIWQLRPDINNGFPFLKLNPIK